MDRSEESLKRIITLMQTDGSVDAPEDALNWSRNIFRTRQAATKGTIVERLKAVLKVDILPGSVAYGERSSGTAKARQMLFEAGDNSIDLRISGAGEDIEIKGQIIGTGFANSTVTLGELNTTANEYAEFAFSDVPPGSYDLLVKTSEREILIEEIDLS